MCFIKPKYKSVCADVEAQNVSQILQKLESILSVRNPLLDLVHLESHVLKAIFILQKLVNHQPTYRVEQKLLSIKNPFELLYSLGSFLRQV